MAMAASYGCQYTTDVFKNHLLSERHLALVLDASYMLQRAETTH